MSDSNKPYNADSHKLVNELFVIGQAQSQFIAAPGQGHRFLPARSCALDVAAVVSVHADFLAGVDKGRHLNADAGFELRRLEAGRRG